MQVSSESKERYRQTDRQQTDRQTDRQKQGETERKKEI